MRIGDDKLALGRALELLHDYAVYYADTVRLYDLGGDPEGNPGPGGGAEPVDSVALSDIGRLVVMNAGIRANDVAALADVDAAAEFAAVPADARLEECVLGNDLYQAATALYEKYRLLKGSNIGQAKRSKLLHLKRPWLVPIADTRVTEVYRRRAAERAAELGIASGHWEAVREDLEAGAEDFQWLTAQLCSHQDPRIQRLGRLTSLRLLDILAWKICDR